jgi:hypothetical protein
MRSGLGSAASVLLILSATTAAAQIGAGSNVIISSTFIAQVKPTGASDHTYNIFEDTRNASRQATPNLLRFYVEPMFLPERVQDGDHSVVHIDETVLKTTVMHDKYGGTAYQMVTRLIIPLLARTDGESIEAANAVKSATGVDVKPDQIGIIPLQEVEISMPDLAGNTPCKLMYPITKLGGNEPHIRVMIDCVEVIAKKDGPRPGVEAFRHQLPYMSADIQIVYAAREADAAFVSINSDQLTSASFSSKLQGKGDQVYVSRDDLRNLAVEASQKQTIAIQGRELSAEEMRTCFTQQMMNFPDISLSISQITPEVLSHTFNGDDLNPTEVNKELSDTLDKGSTEDHYIVNMSGGASGLWGLGEAHASGSADVLKKWMSEHGVKVEWDGKKWIAKGLDVKQVNNAQLTTNISRGCKFQTYSAHADPTTVHHPLEF